MDAPYAVGGCARDQSTTQYCGEAVAAHRRIAELEDALYQARSALSALREDLPDDLLQLVANAGKRTAALDASMRRADAVLATNVD